MEDICEICECLCTFSRICEDCDYELYKKYEAKLKDVRSFEHFLNYKWNHYEDEVHSAYDRYIKLLDRKKTKKSYLYLTLSPDKYLRNLDRTEVNLRDLKLFANKWFDQDKTYYENYAWVIESGSKGDHLHIHAVMEMKTSLKHALKLKNYWKKIFPNNQLLTTINLNTKNNGHGEYAYLQFDKNDILKDKLDYFINDLKGTHTNKFDEGLRGSRGFLTDIKETP